MLNPRPVKASQVIMSELVLPNHSNSLGTAFGGTIMSWIDVCAAIAAQRHSRCTVVTASIDDLHFIKPVHTGQVVNLKSSVNFASKHSMEVGVRVDAEDPKTNTVWHTASAYLTFVALNSDGQVIEIPPVLPETAEEILRFKAGERRRQLRLERREIFKKK